MLVRVWILGIWNQWGIEMPVYKHKMRTFPDPEKRFLFIHIPRTAGRFLVENFKVNNFELEDSFVWNTTEGIERQHFHRDLYEKYLNVEGIPHIAIVRDPVDRFFGASSFLKRMYGNDIQEAMEDPIMFSMMLQNFPLTEAENWYRPQMDFISDKTQLWKLEDGFGEDFNEWMSEILGVPFVMRKVPYKKLAYDEEDKLERSGRLIDNIRQLYSRDYEQLYPELATPL